MVYPEPYFVHHQCQRRGDVSRRRTVLHAGLWAPAAEGTTVRQSLVSPKARQGLGGVGVRGIAARGSAACSSMSANARHYRSHGNTLCAA